MCDPNYGSSSSHPQIQSVDKQSDVFIKTRQLFFLERKGSLRPNNMLAHRFTRFFRLACTDGAIDFPVEFECFVEIVRALDRVAASLVQDRRNHLDECRECWIA